MLVDVFVVLSVIVLWSGDAASLFWYFFSLYTHSLQDSSRVVWLFTSPLDVGVVPWDSDINCCYICQCVVKGAYGVRGRFDRYC